MDQAPDQNLTQGPMPADDAKKSPAYGSILGIILIVAILVAGAFYVWGERLKEHDGVPLDGVRGGEPLPDGSYPTTEGAPNVIEGENGPQPQ